MDELDLADMQALGFLSFALDHCPTMTGPDMNFPTAMSDVINAHFSQSFTSGPSSPLTRQQRASLAVVCRGLPHPLGLEHGTTDLFALVVPEGTARTYCATGDQHPMPFMSYQLCP